MTNTQSNIAHVNSRELRLMVAGVFESLNVEREAAEYVADALVEADEEGISSHGVMLLPMYVKRLQKGSVSTRTEGDIVNDSAGCAVIDAGNMLGQLTARQAVDIVASKAKVHGIATVAVRNGFHFGTAGRYALELAKRGCVGIVMCNTRPLMPAPGGAVAVTGNNPVAIAVPSSGDGPPLVFDMATSASAMGKIRVAAGEGRAIPEGWATDAEGRPTTDPEAAIKGMLLPAAGPKGFGLAFMIDILCGGLSAGAIGPGVRPLYGDLSEPYLCAHMFLAINVEHFLPCEQFEDRVATEVKRLRSSTPAPGVDRIMSPGEVAWRNKNARPGFCALTPTILDQVNSVASELGVATVFASPG